MTRLAAITGATGFLGRYIVEAMTSAGWQVRILARQTPDHPQLARLRFDTVRGDLSDLPALRNLVDGADAVIHAAGLIKARSLTDFQTVNIGGTVNLVTAINNTLGPRRVVMVSSMVAREPTLSAYAATKRAGEEALLARLGPAHTRVIVRPCAVYGPWDRETLAIFRAASRRVFALPHVPQARIALIHAADAAAAIASLCEKGADASHPVELTDARVDGYSWDEIRRAAEMAIGRSILALPLPGMLVRAAGILNAVAARVACGTPIFTLGKAREILHADWGSASDRQPSPDAWQPKVGLNQGFRETVCWYRDLHWLP